MHLTFTAELWIWAAREAESWTFVSLPTDASEEIRQLTGGRRRGFGSVRVRVRVGSSVWQTSIFPDSGRGTYVLPVKKSVRRAEDIAEGDVVAVSVEVIEI